METRWPTIHQPHTGDSPIPNLLDYDATCRRFTWRDARAQEAVVWSKERYGHLFHDNWWQTETGGIMIANFAGQNIKPRSMGRPLPGVESAIVERLTDGVRVVTAPTQGGELALKRGWPSMFRSYLHEEERYKKELHLRLVLNRRFGQARRRRLLPVCGPSRRPDQIRRPSHRSVRSRKRSA